MLKKGDVIWLSITMAIVLFIISPVIHKTFIDFTSTHHYIAGFIKFFILTTMGELLAIRIIKTNWVIPRGAFYKAICGGVYGVLITRILTLFSRGVTAAM